MIDGATRWQTFWKVTLPMVKGGVAASAVLTFVFMDRISIITFFND